MLSGLLLVDCHLCDVLVAMTSIPPPMTQEDMLAKQVTGGELSQEQKKQLEYQRQVCNSTTLPPTEPNRPTHLPNWPT